MYKLSTPDRAISPLITSYFNLFTVLRVLIKVLFLIQFILIGFVFSISNPHSESDTLTLQTQIADSSKERFLESKAFNDLVLWRTYSDGENRLLFVSNTQNQIINRIDGMTYFSIELMESTANSLAVLILGFAVLSLLAKTNISSFILLCLAIGLNHFYFGIGGNFDFSNSKATPGGQQLFSVLSLLIWYLFTSRHFISVNKQSALLAYASQSGSAMQLAKRFYKSAEHRLDLRCISELTPQSLAQYDTVLLIASTYGNGEPPDKALKFVKQLRQTKQLSRSPEFSILALGDRNYQHFCAFGHQLYTLLTQRGARAIDSTTEVDKLDRQSVSNWWQNINLRYQWGESELSQENESFSNPYLTQFIDTKVVSNTQLNPLQSSRHAHCIEIEKVGHEYQPGDLLDVIPSLPKSVYQTKIEALGLDANEIVVINNNSLPLIDALHQREWQDEQASSAQALIDKIPPFAPRTYSIASAPHQDTIRLLVRAHYRKDGSEGVASHYLCRTTASNTISTSVRTHPDFQLPKQNVPLIMIAAGTGLAPFIGFLHQKQRENELVRQAQGGQLADLTNTNEVKHWLFFGEQKSEQDFYFESDIKQFQSNGLLEQLELAWSRDKNNSDEHYVGYINKKVEEYKSEIINLVENKKAHIYVCGSQIGFGESTCDTLRSIFGEQSFMDLREQGLIRTDLY